jgi:hypothetical protein
MSAMASRIQQIRRVLFFMLLRNRSGHVAAREPPPYIRQRLAYLHYGLKQLGGIAKTAKIGVLVKLVKQEL